MKPIGNVEVIPFLPPELECIRELAYNLRWTWDHEISNLFQRLDRDLWESSEHNPVLLLGSISQGRLNEVARDSGFLAQLARVYEDHQDYMKNENTWYKQVSDKASSRSNQVIAYFSAEFGLAESLPIYSGGLGILAGDHLKAASQLGLPLVGVGLVYQEGYFRQYLNQDGWQQERYPLNDFYKLPIVLVREQYGTPVMVSLDFPQRKVYAQIWKAQVGRIPLYLLDTNIDANSEQDQNITDALYHGDSELRMKQEIVLGVGGIKALAALGIIPTVCHMNEGHSAFLALERIRNLIQTGGLGFAEAKEIAQASQVFTTHTSVPAGIDIFSSELVDRYWAEYYREVGLTREEFLGLGRANPEDNHEAFSMAHLAIKLSSNTNAVSKLHGDVSRKLFGAMWKDLPIDEVPINHITNGIHTRSWISDEVCDLYDRYLGPRWFEEISNPTIWKRIDDIPDEELWRMHERQRQLLVNFCRTRVRAQLANRGASPLESREASEILDPNILTIGFARRMATYKRATLLLRDLQRLTNILNSVDCPVQVIIAGKAHPEDVPAKELIRHIVHFSSNKEVKKRFVFLEDYDMNVARHMVNGVDVWLNTPRRFLEACGTSGMKVAFNGGINLSILDGWWDEAYESGVGWAIGEGAMYANAAYADAEYQDEMESEALLDLIEKDLVPNFYDRDAHGLPRAWLARMKASMKKLCPIFNVNRMVCDYANRLYFPANDRFNKFYRDEGKKAKELVAWKRRVGDVWRKIQIEAVETDTDRVLKVGDDLTVRAWINLGDLTAQDVSVQIYQGELDIVGDIARGQAIAMSVGQEKKGNSSLFTGKIRYNKSGRHGFTVRVLPQHFDLVSPFDMGLILWASESINSSVAV